jgi:hypothetical protein
MDNSEFITRYMGEIERLTDNDITNFFKKYYSPATISNITLLPKGLLEVNK